jgi:hypothetical protein
MNEMIAFCGLDCGQCGAFLATKQNDDTRRGEVAERWSKEFGADIRPQDINCEGCMSEGGVLFHHCEVCEIRGCAREKAIANCARCSEYPCDRLHGFFAMVPEARSRLDALRAQG